MDVNSFVIGYNKGKASGGGGMKGFHKVQFFNDDRTTLLYTVFVPTGANAMYAGETPVSTEDENTSLVGFEPSPTNVIADVDTYAVYDYVGSLNETSWEVISELSEKGTAENYFAIGDKKLVDIQGTVGLASINTSLYVYIIGFNHNRKIEGEGIHFGTFKDGANKNVALVDSMVGQSCSGSSYRDKKYFTMNHGRDGDNIGGWKCQLRYDILGSSSTDPLNSPIANTLLAAFPSDLRAVMKPMVKWTDCVGGGKNVEGNVVETIDYLPLLAEFEVFGERTNANEYEQYKQEQYAYFRVGNPVLKYRHNANTTNAGWWFRSPFCGDSGSFVIPTTAGISTSNFSYYSYGLAPIFKV